jgi:hypothetical protein
MNTGHDSEAVGSLTQRGSSASRWVAPRPTRSVVIGGARSILGFSAIRRGVQIEIATVSLQSNRRLQGMKSLPRTITMPVEGKA